MNYDILITIGIVVFGFVFIKYIAPYLKSKNIDFYDEIQLVLLLTGYAFRSDKIKLIANTALNVVTYLEQLSLTPDEKHEEAVKEISTELLEKYNIDMETDVLDTIIRVAVSLLPKTN